MTWTAPSTASVGGAVTAALWNSDVRDNMTELAPFFAAWTSYTPVIKQGVTLTKTVTYAKYVQIGKIVWGNIRLGITSAGTAGQQIRVELPTAMAAVSLGVCMGNGMYWNGSQVYTLAALAGNDGQFVNFDTQGGAGGFGSNPGITAASGHFITFTFNYETT